MDKQLCDTSDALVGDQYDWTSTVPSRMPDRLIEGPVGVDCICQILDEICGDFEENAAALAELTRCLRRNGVRMNTTSTPSKRRKHTSFRVARRGRPRRLFPRRLRGYASE